MRIRGLEPRHVGEIPGTTDVLVVVDYEDFRGT